MQADRSFSLTPEYFCLSFTCVSIPPPETQVNYGEKNRALGSPIANVCIPALSVLRKYYLQFCQNLSPMQYCPMNEWEVF